MTTTTSNSILLAALQHRISCTLDILSGTTNAVYTLKAIQIQIMESTIAESEKVDINRRLTLILQELNQLNVVLKSYAS